VKRYASHAAIGDATEKNIAELIAAPRRSTNGRRGKRIAMDSDRVTKTDFQFDYPDG